jgi:excisionase family DNA binding protein
MVASARVLSTAQAAERTGVTERTIRNWIRNGDLEAVRGPHGYEIEADDLVRCARVTRTDASATESSILAELRTLRLEMRFLARALRQTSDLMTRYLFSSYMMTAHDFARVHQLQLGALERAIMHGVVTIVSVQRGNDTTPDLRVSPTDHVSNITALIRAGFPCELCSFCRGPVQRLLRSDRTSP